MKRLHKGILRMTVGLTMTLVFMLSTALVASASVSVEVSGNIGYVDITETYHITYDANGGDGGRTGPEIVPGGTDTVLSPSEAGISREGYGFLGWNTDKDGGGTHYTSGDTLTLNSNVTLYAQWQEPTPDDSDPKGIALGTDPTASPKTGDMRNMALWYGLFLAALCALLLLFWTERRKNRELHGN